MGKNKRSNRKEKEKEKPRKHDFEVNQALVRDAYIELLKQGKKRPTLAQISERVGLSVTTVKKHVDELDNMTLGIKNLTFKILSDDVILSIFRSAVKGNVAAQKLWLQAIENWNEKTVTEHAGKIETTAPAPPVIIQID